MINPILIRRRQRRYKTKVAAQTPAPPPPGALMLTSAVYDQFAFTVTLGFSRAIDLSGFDGAAILVDDDQIVGHSFLGTGGAELLDESTVKITLVDNGGSVGPGTTLSATSANGIVAVGDGTAWAGVDHLALPFGE